jgi:DNA-binding MarR family transcriptional regulator
MQQKPKMPTGDECRDMSRHCLSLNLRKTERVITRHYDSYLAPAGISAVQLPILAIVATLESPSARAIARELDLDRSTLSRNLNVLVRDGLLDPGTASGPKPGVISLTAKGRETLRRAHPRWRAAHDAVEKAFAAGKVSEVLQTLKTLRRQARAASVTDEA